MPGLGDEFRAAREARHLSLSDVSEQIHIRSVFLDGIEHDEASAIGAPVYVRGFIRTYARFLGIDGEPAVERFNASLGIGRARESVVPEPPIARQRVRRGRPSAYLWLAALAAAILVGFVGYNLFQLPGESQAPRELGVASRGVPETGIAPAKHATSTTAAESKTLEVRLTDTSWLSVSVDGSRRLVGTFPAGTHKAFHGKLAEVRAGNAGAVELTVNGKDLGALGGPGNVVERSIPLVEE